MTAIGRQAAPPRRIAAGRPMLRLRAEHMHLLFLAPVTLFIVALIAWPIVLTVELSLYDIRLFDITRNRSGDFTLDNYVAVLGGPHFFPSLWRTAFFVVVSTGIAFLWGLATALLLDRSFPGRKVARLIIVSPWVIPAAIGSLIWMFLFDGHLGLVNHLLLSVRLIDRPITFLVDHRWAMWAVILAQRVEVLSVLHYHAARRPAGDPAAVLRGGADRWSLGLGTLR